HVSEMGWSRVRHPRDVVSEGDEIDVMILSVDPETERISLSLKETLPDPWADVDSRYRVGDTVEGEVTRVVDFGAFVKLEEGIEGLVHISQLADHHVEKPSDVVKSGQRVLAKVVSLDKAARRIGLSTRDVRSEEDEAPESQTFGASDREDGITLGDMVGDLGSLLSQQQEAQQAEGEEQAE